MRRVVTDEELRRPVTDFATARAIVLDHVVEMPIVSVPLDEALGLAIGASVLAQNNVPPFDYPSISAELRH